MSTTRINVNEVVGLTSKVNKAKVIVNGVMSGISTTKWRTDAQILNQYDINARFRKVHNALWQIERDISSIGKAVENGAIQYQITEATVRRMRNEITANKRTP